MELIVPIVIALVLIVIAWKVLKGLVKTVVLAWKLLKGLIKTVALIGILVVGAVLLFGGFN